MRTFWVNSLFWVILVFWVLFWVVFLFWVIIFSTFSSQIPIAFYFWVLFRVTSVFWVLFFLVNLLFWVLFGSFEIQTKYHSNFEFNVNCLILFYWYWKVWWKFFFFLNELINFLESYFNTLLCFNFIHNKVTISQTF